MERLLTAAVIAAILVGACSSSSPTTVTGLVNTDTGPLSGVTVTGGSQAATTDAQGRFTTEVPSSGTTVLTLSKAGMPQAYAAVTPEGAKLVTVSARMVQPTLTTTVDVRSSPATVTVAGTLELTFPQGSLRTASGAAPGGPVDAAITWLDRNQAATRTPLRLAGSDGTQTFPLITYGMFDVSLRYQGEAVVVASGQTIAAKVPSQAGDPPAAELFSIDKAKGVWKREGTATNTGGFWTAQLPHFSWFNFDSFLKVPPEQQCCVKLVATTAAGQPLGGVIWVSKTTSFPFRGSSDAKGCLCNRAYICNKEIEAGWFVFLDRNAGTGVGGTVTFTPTVHGLSCESGQCQKVEIVGKCQIDANCGTGRTCMADGNCSGAQDGGVAGGSCDIRTGTGSCIEYPPLATSEIAPRCLAAGGIWSGSPCPSAGRVAGRCRFRDSTLPGSPESNQYYYPPLWDLAKARQACLEGGGEWLDS